MSPPLYYDIAVTAMPAESKLIGQTKVVNFSGLEKAAAMDTLLRLLLVNKVRAFDGKASTTVSAGSMLTTNLAFALHFSMGPDAEAIGACDRLLVDGLEKIRNCALHEREAILARSFAEVTMERIFTRRTTARAALEPLPWAKPSAANDRDFLEALGAGVHGFASNTNAIESPRPRRRAPKHGAARV